MKGIDIVYHADNNTMELKDAPDDLLIGTDGDDYATYLKFQIIDDEGILDGFSPYVLFEVESRPMIGLDESYTLNLTQDLLNKARYGKLPFMLVFKGKESTIEIHSVNTLTLGIAHSIDADREVEDDSYDSELAIKYVEITYHAESRLMELTDMPDDQFVGTDGDDYATYLRFTMDDPDGLLTGYGARVVFDVSIKDENGDTYKPFIIIDESMSVPLIQRILSNVKYGAIPIQMAFKGTDSEGRTSQYYSLNKLRLSISDSIRALEGIDVNDRIDINSVINNVEYNPKTATFSFRQIDGGSIAVQLSDLSEEHFEVPTKDDLEKLNKAQNGDTATTLDDGKWYKLYGEYSDPQSWIVMSPSVKAVDDHISDRDNPHNVTKSQIGLGNVDNTSDINKPISTATQNALDTKADSQELSELSKIVSEEIADRESSEGIINESISNHISDTNNPHNVTKEQLGLENVDNTSDVNKPISTATQEALDDKADKTTVSSLRTEFDEEVRVRAEEDTNIKADLDTKADKSDVETALDTKADKTTVSSLSNTLTKEIQDRQAGDNTNATAISTHATNKSNPHNVTKAQVGLGNVDNTSDADKPISTATQNALNLKADKSEISSLYRPKGSVATVNDLPSNAQIGDVYDVQSTGMNYVWTGSKWDELGAIIDLSPYYTKTEVDGALSGKVSKSGDTMTGGLAVQFLSIVPPTLDKNTTIPSATTNALMTFRAKDSSQLGGIANFTQASGNRVTYMKTVGIDGTTEKRLDIWHMPDNTAYLTFPSWSVGTNDNSDKVLTIKMANSLPSLVHTTQNETISGVKRFTSIPIFPQQITLVSSQSDASVYPSTWRIQSQISIRDSTAESREIGLVRMDEDSTSKRLLLNNMAIVNGTTVNSTIMAIVKNTGVAYATAPSTPSVATSNEIVTANWSLGKFVALSGDQTIGGIKTFSNNSLIQSGTNPTIQIANTSKASDPKNWCTLRMTIKNNDATNPSDLTITNINCYPTLTRTQLELRAVHNNTDGIEASRGSIYVIANSDGTSYASAPTPSSKTDNSTKIATTGWVNQTDFLVHTTGNETKSGILTLTDGWRVSNGTTMDVINTNIPKDAYPTATSQRFINFKDAGNIARSGLYGGSRIEDNHIGLRVYGSSNFSGIEISYNPNDNTYKASAPTTPSDATSTEIATANWSLGKFVKKSGDTMTGNLKLQLSDPRIDIVNTRYHRGTAPSGTCYWVIGRFFDNSSTSKPVMSIEGTVLADERRVYQFATISNNDVWQYPVKIVANSDNSGAYMVCPTPASKSENSTQVATTAWVNNADCIVHTTKNEDIDGVKTFSSVPKISTWAQILGVPSSEGWTKIATITKSGSALNRYCALIKVSAPYHRKIGLLNIWAFGSSVFTDCGADWVYNYGYTPNEVAVHLDTSGTVSVWIYQGTNRTQTVFKCVEQYGMWGLDLTSWTILDTDSREFATALPTEGTIHYSTSSKVATPSADATGTEVVNAGWTIDKFVQKTGDTMTGELAQWDARIIIKNSTLPDNTIPTETPTERTLVFSNSYAGAKVLGKVGYTQDLEGNGILTMHARKYDNTNTKAITVVSLAGGGGYATCPSPTDKADNSTKIATTGWVNQTDFLVHSYGNEKVGGFKSYTGDCAFIKSADASVLPTAYENRGSIYFRDNNGTNRGVIRCDADTTYSRTYISAERVINGTHVIGRLDIRIRSDNSIVSYAPQTPNGAVGTEIATANWVNTKLNNKIVASTTDIGEGSALATGTLYVVYE